MFVRSLLILVIATALFAGTSMLGQGPARPQAANRPAADEGRSPASQPTGRSTIRFAERTTTASTGTAGSSAERRRPDKHAPVDPIQANGPIFVDWPRPKVLLLFSGEQDGHLEPCGCAGLNNQKGGLKRRHTLIKQLESRGWPVVAVDVGGQVRRHGAQAQIKFQKSIESLMAMNYAAIGFGPRDLQMDLLPLVINLESPEASPFVSANVAIWDYDSGFTRRLKTVEAGGMRIGITSVLGKKYLPEVQNLEDIKVDEPFQALPNIVRDLLDEDCDQLILLAHADRAEAEVLAKRYQDFGFNWVVVAGGADEPPNVPDSIRNDRGQEISYVIEPGHKGMYVVAVGLYPGENPPFRYQRVPLDHRFEDSPEMQAIFVEYQQELKTLGLDGLGVKPMDHPTGRHFAGSETCGNCHTEAYAVHEGTPHAHATESLRHLEPARQFDPECLSCHVTGWDPQRYFPYTSGYMSLEETPHLTANGCENCHGPARRHADAELGEIDVTDQEREQLRAALRLKIVENEGNKEGQTFGRVVKMCMECHDLDNSPDFDFQLYWPEVEHYGLE